MSSNSLVLNRLFTHSVFQDLIKYEKNHVYSAVVKKYIENYENKRNIDIFEEVYHFMSIKYRNEYFYKNTLLTKLLLHKHNVNNTLALTQIPIGKSKSDFVLINGKATVYEIKSELDNYNRLASQLSDYYKAFDHVCVVAPENEFDKLYEMLHSSPVGIYCLTKRNTISQKLRKEPVICNNQLEHKAIFRVLHKYEYEEVIKIFFGEVPVSSQVEHYDVCLSKFTTIPILDAYKLSLAVMKKRNKKVTSHLNNMPYFLNSVLYFLNPSNKEIEKLYSFLNKQFLGDG